MKVSYLLVLVWMASHLAQSQSSFLPKNLGKSINSTYDEINPVISPDGKTLFFSRPNHPENTYGVLDSEDIWFSKAINDSTWSGAKRISNLNNARYNSIISVSADGKTILVNGVFNKKGNFWKKRGVSVSAQQGDEWSAPVRLKIKGLNRKNSGLLSSGSMSADGDVIFLSISPNYNGKRNDIFVIEKSEKNKWSRPKKVKALNTSSSEEAPFLVPDEKTIYFASDRNSADQFKIYKSIRKGSDWMNWSQPTVLSDTINASPWQSYLRTNKKGSWAYFASVNKSIGKSDIFKVKLFEENPYVIVFGKVINSKNRKPFIGQEFKLAFSTKPIDSVKINYDSATYKAKLPLNNVYQLYAQFPNYISKTEKVDVTGVKEFTRKQIDLLLSSLPYVLVKGKLLVKNSNQQIPATANPKIWINNQLRDSVKINLDSGSYELKINHGVAYEFKVVANPFEPLPEKLDLTSVEEYQVLKLDLFVEEEKMAVVSGKIIDKKTGKPVAAIKAARINVEGLPTVIAAIDTVQSTYELKLPFGKIYSISAAAPNYYPLYENVDVQQKINDKIHKDLVIVPIEVGQSIRLNNIFFDPAKAVLKKESFVELDRVSEFFVDNPEIKVEIAGHTDNVGSAATNLKLSQSRAQAVADYIIKKGIPKERVVAKGYGLAKPVATNTTKDGKAKNRRVEFTILDK